MKKIIKTFLLSAFLIVSCLNLWCEPKKKIEHLDGECDLYLQKNPYQTIDCVNNNIPADFKTIVPGYWNVHIQDGKSNFSADPKTYGCYRYVCTGLDPARKYALLVKDSPKTSCAVFVNRRQIFCLGDPYTMVGQKDLDPLIDRVSYSQIKPVYCEFYPDSKGNAEIIFFITNYFYTQFR